MLDLVVSIESLSNVEPGEIVPQELADLRHIRMNHFSESRDLRLGSHSVLPDESGDGLVPSQRREPDIDEFGRVQVAVEVTESQHQKKHARNETDRDVANGVGSTTPAV